jgi:hypothetical protein
MVRRAESAWRTPVRDFAKPDLGSRPEELRRRANPGETDPDRAGAVERRLEIERAPRNRELSTAWQTPRSTRSWEREPADPVEAVTGAANKLERERRRIHSEFSQQLENA